MHGGHRRPPRSPALARPAPVLGADRGRPRRLDHHPADALKLAHLEHSPYVSCSYWDVTHDTAIAECEAEWVDDVEIKSHAWELFQRVPEPLGHDPYSIWPDGPADPDAGVLRLTPWRVRVATMETLLGRAPVLRRSLEACHS